MLSGSATACYELTVQHGPGRFKTNKLLKLEQQKEDEGKARLAPIYPRCTQRNRTSCFKFQIRKLDNVKSGRSDREYFTVKPTSMRAQQSMRD